MIQSGECGLGGICVRTPLTLVLARNRLTRTAAERGFVLSGECVPGGVCSQPAYVLARNRLTRTAAERGPVLSGECGQVAFAHSWPSYWLAIALRGRPLSAALSSPASAASQLVPEHVLALTV
jgi:hypothetical protein